MTDTSYCWIHHEPEAVPQEVFLICFECKHVFRTAQDLVDGHNAVLARLREPGEHWTPLMVGEVYEIWCCPVCTHDF